jgi:hypothetical protein
LKGLAAVAQAEGHTRILKKSKRGDDSSFLDVGCPHRDLVISLFQVELAENSAPAEAGCQIVHTGKRIFVRLRDEV